MTPEEERARNEIIYSVQYKIVSSLMGWMLEKPEVTNNFLDKLWSEFTPEQKRTLADLAFEQSQEMIAKTLSKRLWAGYMIHRGNENSMSLLEVAVRRAASQAIKEAGIEEEVKRVVFQSVQDIKKKSEALAMELLRQSVHYLNQNLRKFERYEVANVEPTDK